MTWIKEEEIVKLLKTKKWSIGFSNTFTNSFFWMQKGGLGHGGESKKIHSRTFWVMYEKGLLKNVSEEEVGTQEYRLNEK